MSLSNQADMVLSQRVSNIVSNSDNDLYTYYCWEPTTFTDAWFSTLLVPPSPSAQGR